MGKTKRVNEMGCVEFEIGNNDKNHVWLRVLNLSSCSVNTPKLSQLLTTIEEELSSITIGFSVFAMILIYYIFILYLIINLLCRSYVWQALSSWCAQKKKKIITKRLSMAIVTISAPSFSLSLTLSRLLILRSQAWPSQIKPNPRYQMSRTNDRDCALCKLFTFRLF